MIQTVDFPPAERKDTAQNTESLRQKVDALTKANQPPSRLLPWRGVSNSDTELELLGGLNELSNFVR